MRVSGRTVREIFKMAALGIGHDNIAKNLGNAIPSRFWVAKTLCNRAAIGEFQPSIGDAIANYFPAVVSMTEWQAARTSIGARSKLGLGNTRNSYRADNLFTGLVYSATDGGKIAMNFQKVQRGCYLVEAKDCRNNITGQLTPINRKQRRVSYDKFETAMLCYLTAEDWSAIASQSESDELKAARVDLEEANKKIDAATVRIQKTEAALESCDDAGAMVVLASKLSKDQAALAQLELSRAALEASVRAATAAWSELHHPEAMLDLIKQSSTEANDVRLRLRSEIRKRIQSISMLLGPFTSPEGQVVGLGTLLLYVRFINGVVRLQAVDLETGQSKAVEIG